MIKIGFVGAPSTGKTTLAQALVDALRAKGETVSYAQEIDFIEAVRNDMGLIKSMTVLPEGTRARVDIKRAKLHLEHLRECVGGMSADYYVEDAAIYQSLLFMMVLCGSFTFCHSELRPKAEKLYREILEEAKKFYDLIVFCPLGRVPVDRIGRPFASEPYLQVLETLLVSWVIDYARDKTVFLPEVLSSEEALNRIESVVMKFNV